MALYMWRGTGSAYWLPADIEVGPLGPTEEQLADPDVLDLTDSTTGVSGLETTPNNINVPILRSRTPIQIAGEETLGTPTLTVVDDDGTDSLALLRQEVLDTLTPGAEGTLVFFLHTQAPAVGDKCYWQREVVSAQVPTLTLDAAASTVGITFAASHALRKGAVQA
ncbi:hypothetical protein [Cellulomonas sp.]|uniref:phage tail tube protein n=1 Tax=Cellulomonas sp. TaxID=40001 RepID=UPI001B1DC6E4|nr:hypothetical protein [Cellulomonas sp.]MBO9555610.1 hypothetical protein [Cellulomonas sp.]